MRLIPKTRTDSVAFFSSHIAKWSENWSAIGLSEAAVAELQAKLAAAQGKLLEQREAEQRARSATRAANDVIAALVECGSDMVKAIRAKAAAADDNSVYVLAQIPPPAAPSPVNKLGEPSQFEVELGADGALTLKWKCKNPRASGTVYQLWRSLDGGANFAFVGATGSKSFVDNTLPAGCARVLYRVQAVRSTATGPCAMFNVQFGGGRGAGGQAVSVQPKLAA